MQQNTVSFHCFFTHPTFITACGNKQMKDLMIFSILVCVLLTFLIFRKVPSESGPFFCLLPLARATSTNNATYILEIFYLFHIFSVHLHICKRTSLSMSTIIVFLNIKLHDSVIFYSLGKRIKPSGCCRAMLHLTLTSSSFVIL